MRELSLAAIQIRELGIHDLLLLRELGILMLLLFLLLFLQDHECLLVLNGAPAILLLHLRLELGKLQLLLFLLREGDLLQLADDTGKRLGAHGLL